MEISRVKGLKFHRFFQSVRTVEAAFLHWETQNVVQISLFDSALSKE